MTENITENTKENITENITENIIENHHNNDIESTYKYERELHSLNKIQKGLKREIKTMDTTFTHLTKQYIQFKKELDILDSKRKFSKMRVALYKSNVCYGYIDSLKALNDYDMEYENLSEYVKECRTKMEYIITTLHVTNSKYKENTELIDVIRAQLCVMGVQGYNDTKYSRKQKKDRNTQMNKLKKWWSGFFRCI